MTNRNDRGAYLPTPEEITTACESIQARWTEEERYRRIGGACDSDSTDDVAADRQDTKKRTSFVEP